MRAITSTLLKTVGTGFKGNFQQGLGMVEPAHNIIATTVKSSTGKEEYGWLGKIPSVRKWIGDRVVNGLQSHGYTIKNDDFELTLGVDRNDIEDDTIGMYAPLFQEMGLSVAAHPSELCFGLLQNGFTEKCYDGQFFFDTDHPVLDKDGNVQSVSNYGGGAGTPWYLIVGNRAIKPIIYQERKPLTFVPMDNPDDPNVFNKKEFVYGVDGRMNVGFSFWQFAYASKQDLTPANYGAAFAAIEGMKGDHGRPLGLKPTHLVVPSTLREKAQIIINNQNDAAGATNSWKDSAKLEVISWLG